MDADVPRWAAPVTLLLSVAGLLFSAYLTLEHYTTAVALVCPETGVVNCAKVTSSPQSELFGIPVALLGLLYFAALVPLMLPVAWRRDSLTWVRLGAVSAGLPMLAYLIHAETVLRTICLYCTVVHVIHLALFCAVIVAVALREPRTAGPPGRTGEKVSR